MDSSLQCFQGHKHCSQPRMHQGHGTDSPQLAAADWFSNRTDFKQSSSAVLLRLFNLAAVFSTSECPVSDVPFFFSFLLLLTLSLNTSSRPPPKQTSFDMSAL